MLDQDARPLTDNERAFLMEDEDTDDTRREDEPGDWFVAGFDGECSRGGETFGAKVTIRADGDGGHECRVCVTEDQRTPDPEPFWGESSGPWTREDDKALDPDDTLATEVLTEMRGER